MKHWRILVLVAVVATVGVAGWAGGSRRCTAGDAGCDTLSGLAGGASSIDDLVGRFLVALESRDRPALDGLRVSQREYREWIVPGSVEVGESPQRLSPEASVYFWEVLDGKARYYRESLLAEFGGRRLRLREVRFRKGTKHYANHVAHRRLELALADETGNELELLTGSVAEVDGQFKFISYIRD